MVALTGQWWLEARRPKRDEVVRYSAVTPDIPIPTDKLAWMRELLTKTGNLTKPLDLARFTDDSLRAKALELAGK